jgi:hypothetical protein
VAEETAEVGAPEPSPEEPAEQAPQEAETA